LADSSGAPHQLSLVGVAPIGGYNPFFAVIWHPGGRTDQYPPIGATLTAPQRNRASQSSYFGSPPSPLGARPRTRGRRWLSLCRSLVCACSSKRPCFCGELPIPLVSIPQSGFCSSKRVDGQGNRPLKAIHGQVIHPPLGVRQQPVLPWLHLLQEEWRHGQKELCRA